MAFFTSARPSYPPVDIWMSKRGDAGWSEPTKLEPPISSDADEFEVAISRNGTLYFSSTREGGQGDIDIYRARLVDGGYPTIENLGPPINTSSGDDLPYIAPDESYLIFASDRPDGLGNRDLYISFQADGAWTEAKNLGPPINSEYWDIYPSVSPDGKYLFFTKEGELAKHRGFGRLLGQCGVHRPFEGDPLTLTPLVTGRSVKYSGCRT
jgi:hypothetical protein